MFFSNKFNIKKEILNEYGAVDLLLSRDLPLFIDPILIFTNPKYKEWHNDIIKYFNFLYLKTQQPNLSPDEIKHFFSFHEIKNNWLGLSEDSNNGRGFGQKLTEILKNNLSFIFQKSDFVESCHIEKCLLLTEKSGKDLISDLTCNVILKRLLTYTEIFAKNNIDPNFCSEFTIDHADFDYDNEIWLSKKYYLPFIENKSGNQTKLEWIILTPFDILRKGEPSICRNKLVCQYDCFANFIPNEEHRQQFNNYIVHQLELYRNLHKNDKKQPTKLQISKAKKQFFIESLKKFPWLYDYFVLANENDKFNEGQKALEERTDLINVVNNFVKINELIQSRIPKLLSPTTSDVESKTLLLEFKNWIENQDGWKMFWPNNELILRTEDMLNIAFRLLKSSSNYDINTELNNGRGEADVAVSFGRNDKCIIEFKLASNPKILNIFKQAEIYANAGNANKKVYCIFICSETEQNKIDKFTLENPNFIKYKDNIIFIDVRNDNKQSASRT